ncbi:glycoside hydrolase family 19 protein [Brucella anthropi]|uniref:Chitinase-like protein n=1 Tax=Brucella anthropi (strain ATCC 49188 / DSM 6882 / CCUG 24695 / JCM 21032 / LMG 3331 / NBRC 15819 / NCTC 12168 / Alc 37) TaxID=439375 RepID=A6WYZ7_BRUA4|nr:peptidoglycan-binding protein [Brucella anthropi]ABS14201.1 chitinase-like protein [Brucella anthropi ATCC 49188]QQC25723.1 glycoside hydrolase family 19 protein [Brucella anthropi]SUA65630.1 Predicted chitinase [Brucella anthropi]
MLKIIQKIVGGNLTSAQKANANSVIVALNEFGPAVGLNQPHRLAQYLAQILHESGSFRYDREVWGPTEAQKRYDTRTDLGNTAALDGDGYLFRGRTSIQITGKYNTTAFRDWCRTLASSTSLTVPDFVKDPDAMNTDPWEGLGPIWYWDTRNLNVYADRGDNEMITKKINGGLNGYQDRLDWYTKTALVLLGYDRGDIRSFQKAKGLAVDGIAGPRTRSALHKALVSLTAPVAQSDSVMSAPVVEEKPVVPPVVEQKAKSQTNLWGWLTTALGGGGAGITALLGADWKSILAFGGLGLGGLVILTVVGPQIARAIRNIQQELA